MNNNNNTDSFENCNHSSVDNNYRRRGYVLISVRLFVRRITQVLDRFTQNSMERWHMGHGRKPLDFGGNVRQDYGHD